MSNSLSRPGELQTDPTLGLSFRLIQPAPAQPRHCVILLHGVGSNESNMAELARGMAANTLVILPRGPLTLGPGQFAWFRVALGANGPSINTEEAEHSRQTLIHFVQHVQFKYGVAPANTVIAGFSQGEQDPVLPVAWAQRSDALLTQLGVAHDYHLYPMDHGISEGMHADFLSWLASLNARP